ncbi:hypothetical protein N7466_007296 [Penicillium verhagenii]|uniref:uncharacterized protein n=1 Tax=Penicillium verhagenii TaxID=1562060 RepID=UPI0025452D8F|nr:uncharacterized protein N7466_007296 [Penicillium verhagenii]KAJ5928340.1 hypothetical protein N7466_007296 [Penicillium verhagenii]
MASRRNNNSSEESAASGASSIARDAEVARSFLDSTELALQSDSVILHRSLNLKSVISTISSFSCRFQSARFRTDLQEINQIGIGLQGAIFEIVGKLPVIKKETPGNEMRSSNLRREYQTHCDVSAAFQQYQSVTQNVVHVPTPHTFIWKTEEDSFWNEIMPKMPQAFRQRGNVVTMERILPLPKVVRKALITHVYGRERNLSTTDIDSILHSPANKHCLARVYLGKANGSMSHNKTDLLRNIPLHLGILNELGIDTFTLALEMGKSYATLHWGAATNGDDVEFVLGTSVSDERSAHNNFPDFQHRAIGFYLLDFGQCEAVDLAKNSDDVYQAFKGALVTGDNQLFIPHYSKSPTLFASFKKGYIDAGNAILSAKHLTNKFNMVDFMQQYEEYAEDFLY